jgi:hypothetical protein
MKFCVFGFTKPSVKVAKAKNNLSPNPFSFEESLKCYEEAVNSFKYVEVYFLVDFGFGAEIPFYKAVKLEEFGYITVPWVTIQAADIDIRNKKIIRWYPRIRRGVILKLKGFSESFDDPMKGFKRFMYYYDSKLKCDLFYNIDDQINVFVTNTQICISINNNPKTKYCRKYKF